MLIKRCGAYCSLVLNLLKLVSANKRCDYSLKLAVAIKEIVIQWFKNLHLFQAAIMLIDICHAHEHTYYLITQQKLILITNQ